MTELWAEPGFAAAGDPLRAWLGRSLHHRHQAEAARSDPSYRAEVPLCAELEHEGWRVTLRGRADGVRREGACAVIEELKSEAAPGTGSRRAATLQVRTYAWMWQREGRGEVRTQLVWLPLLPEEPLRREPVATELEALEGALRTRLSAWIARAREDAARKAARRRAAPTVTLPFAAWRPGQEELARDVERALEEREQLLVEAPTGAGKSLAVLLPALRFALARDKRLAVLAPTGLAQRAAWRALASLAPAGVPTAVRLRARANMCAAPGRACQEDACDFARTHAAAVADGSLVQGLFSGSALAEPAVVRAAGEAAGACPFALSLAAAESAVATVGDYNYAFDPGVALFSAEDPALGDLILVVDEVHRLAERARESRSPALDEGELRAAAAACATGDGALHRDQARALLDAADWVRSSALEALALPEGAPLPDASLAWEPAFEVLAERARALEALLPATFAYRAATRAYLRDDPFLSSFRAVRRLLATSESPPCPFAGLVSTRAGSARVMRLCLDAGPELSRLLSRCHAFVGLSATLGDPELCGQDLGLDPARKALSRARLPFGTSGLRLVIDAGVDTTARRRAAQIPAIARRLSAFAEALPGSCLALLPSHATLDAVRRALPPLSRALRWQHAEDDEAEREAHVAALEGRPPVLMLAVAGGVFAESLDLRGGRLCGVAVVSPCLPAPSLPRELLRAHHDGWDGRGFERAYVEPGMARVVQAAGRLIRAEGQRGVIALFGRRFLREPFRARLPADWLKGHAPEAWAGDPARVAAAFFREAGGSARGPLLQGPIGLG